MNVGATTNVLNSPSRESMPWSNRLAIYCWLYVTDKSANFVADICRDSPQENCF